jgi:hypothetical protein
MALPLSETPRNDESQDFFVRIVTICRCGLKVLAVLFKLKTTHLKTPPFPPLQREH